MSKETFSRRVLPTLTLIGASGFLLAALDRPSTGIDLGSGPPLNTEASPATTTPVIVVTVPPTSTGVTAPPSSAGVTAPPSSATATAPPPVQTTVPPAPAVCGATIVGPTISTKYGPVQVQASVDGQGLVCSAQGIVWPTADGKSVRINDQAIPLLNQWSVHSGNASFNSISGATYTSKAYKKSLQAIIDGVVR
ncbi:MAG: FMN-binding protein [Actinobacteria bacterium]|nr:FMN-binding protein [Actinomycetota bacterium]